MWTPWRRRLCRKIIAISRGQVKCFTKKPMDGMWRGGGCVLIERVSMTTRTTGVKTKTAVAVVICWSCLYLCTLLSLVPSRFVFFLLVLPILWPLCYSSIFPLSFYSFLGDSHHDSFFKVCPACLQAVFEAHFTAGSWTCLQQYNQMRNHSISLGVSTEQYQEVQDGREVPNWTTHWNMAEYLYVEINNPSDCSLFLVKPEIISIFLNS